MNAHCPSCGFNLVPEKVVVLGAMTFDPRGEVRFHGERLKLTPGQRDVLGTLLAEAGKWVSVDVLLNRVGSEAESANLVDVHLTNLRKKLRAVDPEANHIETRWGGFRRWK